MLKSLLTLENVHPDDANLFASDTGNYENRSDNSQSFF